MIPPAVTADPPAVLAAPAIVAPAPREVSFGRVAGRVDRATERVVVLVDGERRAEVRPQGRRFRVRVALPPRDVTVRVVARDAEGSRASASVRHVFGLPRSAFPRSLSPYEDARLARKLRTLARRFPQAAAVYVLNLRTGAGAAWNARARFPAASTLKLAIAVEVLRVLRSRPPRGSRLDRLLRTMLVRSSNHAANRLLVWLAGSTAAGGARVTSSMRALGLADSVMYGGYILGTAAGRRPIPLRVDRQPRIPRGKYTTAWDLARLHRFLHRAAGGGGPLVRRLRGAFSPADARAILYLLAHSTDHGKLDRYVRGPGVAVPHKAGWIEAARNDAGIVFWPDGAFVAAVMTWRAPRVGPDADVLAGRVAAAALGRFRAPGARPDPGRRALRL